MRKKLNFFRLGGMVLFLSFSWVGAVSLAQTITGSVRGTVTDPSGAVVQKAAVVVTNVDTGVTTKTMTNKAGQYNVDFLPIGNYSVTVTAAGFDRERVGPFPLRIDQIASIDAKLKLGSTSETLSITAETAALNTENATVSTSISAEQLENMPLNGLNVQEATLFVPGAVIPDQSAMGGLQGTERDAMTTHAGEAADALPTFNGNRQQNNSYILDGVDINETLQNALGYNPSPFSIQEVHVITSNADAEYGNVNGGEVVMVTKNGTNQFHGNVFEYHENSGLQANTYSNKHSRIAKAHMNQNQFGAAVGGPIIRDKLFFFGNFIGLRNTNSYMQAESVPTAAERGQGPGAVPGFADLSILAPNSGGAITDWTTGVNYPNNLVPIVNSAAKYIFAQSLTNPNLLPLPNHAPSDGITSGNYYGLASQDSRNYQGDLRLDYTLNNNNTFMAKFSRGEAHDNQTAVPMEVLIPVANDYPFTNLAFSYTHIFNSKIVNNARAGFTRIVLNQNSTSDPSGIFGTSGDAKLGISLPKQPLAGFSYLAIQQGDNTADLSNWGTPYYLEAFNLDNNFDYNDTLTWQHGTHVTKFGFDFVRYQQNYFTPSNIGGEDGVFNYDDFYTSNGYSDFLTDRADSNELALPVGPFGQRQWRDAVFVQDDWRVRPNLTLNLGLRYSYDQPMYEVNNKEVNLNFAIARFAPAGTPVANMVEQAGAFNSATGKTNSRSLYNPYYLNFMPRFGIAWTIQPRLVLRGGAGITDELESTGTGLRLTQNAPYQPSYFNTVGNGPYSVTSGFTGGVNGGTGSSFRSWDPDIHPAQTSQFNVALQYLLTARTSLTVGYLGQISKHLVVPIAINQYTQDAPSNCDAACFQRIEPFYQLVGPGNEVVETASRANANYNSLQATLQRQQSNGLMFVINYAYAKSLTNNPGFFNVDAGSVTDSYWQDINNPNGQYGPSNFDLRHNFNGTMTYQLPFGRGKQFASNANRLADEIIGGWQFSTNAEIHTGFPLGFFGSPQCNNNCPEVQTNSYAAPALYLRPINIVNRGAKDAQGNFLWFGTDPSAVPCGRGQDNGQCAFAKLYDFGTAKPGMYYGPGFDNWDLSLQKGFATFESQMLTVRVDAFNAFNISSYGNPATNVGSPSNFGRITGTRSGPRTLQLSAVYKF